MSGGRAGWLGLRKSDKPETQPNAFVRIREIRLTIVRHGLGEALLLQRDQPEQRVVLLEATRVVVVLDETVVRLRPGERGGENHPFAPRGRAATREPG